MITNLLEYSISDNDTIQLQPLTNYSADVISVNPFKYDKKCIASIIHNPRNIRNTFYYSSNITQYLTDENLMALKSFNLQDCKEFQGIFTRENVDRFIRSSKCLWVKSAIRSHSLLLNYWRGIHTIKNITTDLEAYKKAHNYSEWFNYYPIYYMVPKCGSSSVFNMMKYLNMFRKQGQIGHALIERPYIRTECGFAFVRDPMERLISGYYTANALLWRHFGGTFVKENITDMKSYNAWKYVSMEGEPQRFHSFANELISMPHRFTRYHQNDHVSSQSDFLSYFLPHSDIHFIGRVENFNEHWQIFSKGTGVSVGCNRYFTEARENSATQNTARKLKHKSAHEMPSFGWGKPSSWVKEPDVYMNWVMFMGLKPIFDHWKSEHNMDGILPPAWYAMNETLFENLVDYYWQDYQCFNYNPSWTNFKEKRDKAQNIYDIQT